MHSAAVRRDKLRSALEAWDPSLARGASRKPFRPDKKLEPEDLSALKVDKGLFDHRLHAATWSQLPKMGMASSLEFRLAQSKPEGEGVGCADGAHDVSSQVLGRLLLLLKEKENKWRSEVQRASLLEGQNAELRARLAASEKSNARLKGRLHSGVAAFHRTLAQAKDKIVSKDADLCRAKTLSLELHGPSLPPPFPYSASALLLCIAKRRGKSVD